MRQTVYYNGTVLTMRGEEIAQAVLVEDGRIAAVGTNVEVLNRKSPDAEVVNLEGKTLLPAFIDPHSHFTSVASMLDKVDLSGVTSVEEIGRRLCSFVQQRNIGPDQVLVGSGYDHNDLPGFQHPTAAELDRVGPENPVIIAHSSGHMGVANSRMLAMLGLTAGAADPEGGRYGRLPDGSLSGYLEENAFIRLAMQMPEPSEEQLLQSYAGAQAVYASRGIATVQDGMTSRASAARLEKFGRSEACYLDIVGYADLRDPEHTVEDPRRYRGHYRTGGYKLFLDGSPQGRTAWMSEPYLGGDPGYCGYPIYSDREVIGLIDRAVGEGRQLLTHCNGDAASEQLLRCYKAVADRRGGAGDLRPVMVHCQTVRPDQLARMPELGMIASFFVVHTYYWGDVHIRNFGERRGRRISPMRSAIDRGVVYTMHQDSPVVPPDMLLTIWAAVNRVSKNGTELAPEERISVWEALRGVTVNAAYQYHEEADKGTIEPGKLADLVILERNPLLVPKQELKDIRVLETVKAGRTIYKAD